MDLADSLQYVNDAQELWKELEDRYDQTNGAKLYQLQREKNELSQGTLDIMGYYTKMKKLWEELNTLNAHAQCKCNFTCGAKANIQKAKQDRRLIQFLMGLNEVYIVVRGSILMMNPLPSLAQAFSILIQEEKQREEKPNNQLEENRTGNNNYRGGHFGNRPRPFYGYCKRQGHTKARCYKLHGYPQDPRLNKGKRIAANVHGGQGESAIEGADGSNGISACSTHFDSESGSYEFSKSITDSWILDSGASNHMTYNKSMLTNIKTLVYPFLVTLPNGYKVKVTLMGDVVMSPKFTLKRVLFVPSFKFNLISVHCLTVQFDCFVIFTKFFCILLQDPSLKRPLAIGESKDGLYLYKTDSCKSNNPDSCKLNSLVFDNSSSASNKGDVVTQPTSSSITSVNSISSHPTSHTVSSLHNSVSPVVTNSYTYHMNVINLLPTLMCNLK
uniref:Retrovirus-related Pol polyprotein from transposon TNT 1-94-like beta-barrel domain-containing protein n=1 Tax=Nicotiana tabacum TaxID=4097 RepID=A0A1S3ZBD2_TOBAC|nr:PREDICTED: uncharacterized protein LOC107785036 [Nicotiana tabacum]